MYSYTKNRLCGWVDFYNDKGKFIRVFTSEPHHYCDNRKNLNGKIKFYENTWLLREIVVYKNGVKLGQYQSFFQIGERVKYFAIKMGLNMVNINRFFGMDDHRKKFGMNVVQCVAHINVGLKMFVWKHSVDIEVDSRKVNWRVGTKTRAVCWLTHSKLNGKYRCWYNTGTQSTICYYKNGKLHGVYAEWYSNGHLMINCLYASDILEK